MSATVGTLALTTGVGWYLAGSQAVRGQEAIDHKKEADAASKDPVVVSASYRPRADDAYGWVFASPLPPELKRRLLATDDPGDPDRWAPQHGGVRVAASPGDDFFNFSRVRVVLRGQWVRPILVARMRAMVQRSAPWGGAVVWAGAQGESALVDVGFDLDEKDPVARSRTDLKLGRPYADEHQLTVVPDEIVPVEIMALTRQHLCQWRLEFTFDVDQKTVTKVIGDGDAPFRTCAFATHYGERYFYSPGSSAYWRAAGPGAMRK